MVSLKAAVTCRLLKYNCTLFFSISQKKTC